MLIESNDIRKAIVEIKDQRYHLLDKTKIDKVRNIIDGQIQIMETFLIWLSNTEKEGAVDMEKLKTTEYTMWT